MTIKELLEMEIHEEHVFNQMKPYYFRTVIRVPGGWIYETETCKNEMYTGGKTSCFVPEPNSQATSLSNSGYDEWLQTVEPDMPEPEDYDKTAQSEKNFLTMGSFN